MILKLIYFSFCLLIVSSQEWSYRDQQTWRRTFDSCGGRRQSPINIISSRLRRNPSLRLIMDSYEIPHRNIRLQNTGHTAELSLNSRNPTMNIGVGRDAVPYVFQNMHFHWGRDNFEGSEHSVDNSFGSAEIHFVHYNQRYGSFIAARNRKDGIVVVTVLVQVSRQDNRALEPIIRSLPQIINPNTTTIIQRLNFGRILPRNKQLFFQYAGSLTTPPCSETVTFIIFAEPIRISAIQLSQFRRLFEESNGRANQRITSNTRVLQPLNGRVVEVSVPRGGRALSPESEPEPEPSFAVNFEDDFINDNFI